MLKVFTAFSGYDSQLMALDRLGINYDCIGWSEIDKYAIKAHNVIYPQYADRNYGNICAIDWNNVPDFDLFTYSFPCTDISSVGKQKGLEKSSGTRSSLLWECEKAIRIKRPKYLVMENVKALVSEKFKAHFLEWEQLLAGFGYSNFSKVLNSKDYGVPQNRERIFMVSILNDIAQPFFFPKPFKLEKRLKDVLEDDVDSKYYLSGDLIKSLVEHCERKQAEGCGFKFKPIDGSGVSKTVTTREGNRHTDNYIKVEQTHPISILQTARGYNKGGEKDICPTVTSNSFEQNNFINGQRIRKLTPRECFRLMGARERNIELLLQSGISNTQLYKMAGNSIVVDVLFHLFRKLLVDIRSETPQLQLF